MNKTELQKPELPRIFLTKLPLQKKLTLLIFVLLVCMVISFQLLSNLGVNNLILDITLGAVVVITGTFIAWTISRKITIQLKKLTRGSAAIAVGDYSKKVNLDRQDEFGKLARTINLMADQMQKSQKDLEKKARDYKLLFERNPMAMWIISPFTLEVLDVNQAATWLYGYSKAEFLNLNSRSLRPDEEVAKYVAHMESELREQHNTGVWRHRKKDGTIIMVEIHSDEIVFKEEPARIVLANDVTEKLKTESDLTRQTSIQQKLITETSIEVQEREREEIGKELHDNINQILASTKLFLGHAIENQRHMLPELLMKSYQNVTLAMEEIRQLSQTLVAPSLGDITLAQAFGDLTANFNLASSFSLEIKCGDFIETGIDKNRKLMIYRIVQEQMNNILKHSRATFATIHIENTATDIILTIQDNGIGFDQQKKIRGIGLRNITNRAGFYNGTVSIISSPGKGCCLIVTIPVKSAEKQFATERRLPQIM